MSRNFAGASLSGSRLHDWVGLGCCLLIQHPAGTSHFLMAVKAEHVDYILRLVTWSYESKICIEALALNAHVMMKVATCHGLSQWPGISQNFLVPSILGRLSGSRGR